MSMLFVYGGLALAILIAIGSIIKWWNLPKTIEERRLAAEAKAKAQAEKIAARRAEAEKRRIEAEKRRKERDEARANRRRRQ